MRPSILGIWMAITLTFFPAEKAMASYVNTCILYGKILDTPRRTGAQLRFRFKATRAHADRFGRVDGRCYVTDTPLEVTLFAETALPALQQGQHIWLRALHMTGMPNLDSLQYDYLGPSEAKAAIR